MKKTPKITIAATAQLLGCSVRQVSTFAKEGLPHTKDRRGRLKFDPEQARQWRISHSHGGNILAAPPDGCPGTVGRAQGCSMLKSPTLYS